MINTLRSIFRPKQTQYKNEMGRTFQIAGTLGTKYTQMLFAFFVVRAILSP